MANCDEHAREFEMETYTEYYRSLLQSYIAFNLCHWKSSACVDFCGTAFSSKLFEYFIMHSLINDNQFGFTKRFKLLSC